MASNYNQNDITMMESESSSDEDSQSSEEFNFAVALQLRKNLSSTFDKHIHASSSNNVSAKIARFEQQTSTSTTASSSNVLPPRPVAAGGGATKPSAAVKKSTPLGVYLRVRPISSKQQEETTPTLEIQPTIKSSDVPTTVRTFPPVDSNAAKVARGGGDENSTGAGIKEFEFSQVFGPESSQSQVYGEIAAPLVNGLFPSASSATRVGESALLFAYGITNAGKTHTIMGNTKDSQQWGIIPRALQDIFSHMEQRNTTTQTYSLNLAYLELYNEGIYDLLPKEASKGSNKFLGASRESLKLRESRNGQTFVRGLTKHKVSSVAHGLQLAQQAATKRHTSSNNINADSSRSHCVCQLEITVTETPSSVNLNDNDDNSTCASMNGYTTDDEAARLMHSRDKTVTLWIVDLAGSERSKRTGVLQGSIRQKEAALINSSLMKLMRCLSVMRRNQSQSSTVANNVVPFRESKLTHLFMPHLTGPSANRTLMIVNVNPSAADFDETQHVLAYATAARTVQISQDDLPQHRKRKGGDSNGAGSSEATHDYNGRALKRIKSSKGTAIPATNKSGQTNAASSVAAGAAAAGGGGGNKISKLVRHFSPKKLAAKRMASNTSTGTSMATATATGGPRDDSRKRKMMDDKTSGGGVAGLSRSHVASSTNDKAGSKTTAGMLFAQGKPKEVQLSGSTDKELKQLKTSLSIAEAEAEVLRSEKNQLEEQLSQQEAQVRMELATDMEEQMRVMREQYDDIIESLKAQVQSAPTPAKSVKKAQMDHAEQQLEELLDQVEECEEEMKRMRKAHAVEVAALEEAHGKAIQAKDNELLELTSTHKGAIAKFESTNRTLQKQLETSRDDYTKLEKSKQEMIQSYEALIREQDEEDSDDDEDSEEEEQESSPTPVRRGRSQKETAAAAATRRLPRNRTSKVAVQTMNIDNVPKSSGKKPSRRLRSKRAPLSPIPPTSSNQNSSPDSNDSFGPDKLLRPKKPVERCESTGSYLRPRGRAPSGREWDEKVGAWRLSMAG